MKPIYYVIGALVIVLIIILVRGSRSSATNKSAPTTGATTGSSLADAVNQIVNSEPPPDSGECRRNCDNICKPCSINLNPFKAGPRRQCELDCRSSCAKGEAYKTLYPNC